MLARFGTFLALCAAISEAKVWSGSVRLSIIRPWAVLTSFAYNKGVSSMRLELDKLSLADVPEGITFLAILDEDWSVFIDETDCAARERLNRWYVPASPDGNTEFETAIRQYVRPHVWYLVASYCPNGENRRLTKTVRIKAKATFIQDGGSHISYEDKPTRAAVPLTLLAFSVALAIVARQLVKRRKEGGGFHPTLGMMMGALSMHWLYLVLHSLHLSCYAGDGTGYPALDVIGELLHYGGQLLVSYVLVGLAYGWTLSSAAVQNMVPDDKSVVYLMAGCLGFVHLMFIILGRMNDDHYAKSHALDSIPAYFLVLMRLILLAVFMVGAVKTFEAESNSRRRSFIGRLIVLGTLWFAAMPLLVLIAMVCAEYVREPVVSVGGLLAQSLGLFVLSWLFLTRNEYYKMSTLANTGMLPTRNTFD